jgi:hypothetical protein
MSLTDAGGRHGQNPDYFWSLIRRGDGCWPWAGTPASGGYGRLKWGGRQVRAHRVAWELTHGPVPPGLVVMHKCDNRLCCNPAHLEVGTQRDNILDMHTKGRWANLKGERHYRASLSDADAFEIRVLGALGWGLRDLARLFGVSEAVVRFVMEGRTYRHLPMHRDAKFANAPPKPGRSSTSFVATLRRGRSPGESTGKPAVQIKAASQPVNNAGRGEG